jgi:TetR/AcrR family transcriptional regulator
MARPRLRDLDPDQPATGERLLNEAERLFAVNGFAGVSLRDIGKAASLSNAALLHYYPSKEKLYRAVLDRVASDMEQAVAPVLRSAAAPVTRFEALFDAFADWLERTPDRARLVMRELTENVERVATAKHFAMTNLIDGMSQVILDGQRAGVFRRCDAFLFVFHMIGSLSYFANGLPTMAGLANRKPEALWQAHRRQTLAHLRRALLQEEK